MDWIEQWFGLNPDQGDGSVEWLILLMCVVVAITLVGRRKGRRARRADPVPPANRSLRAP